jgi:uncharacterized membrane protein YqgA involved in biofilm formation
LRYTHDADTNLPTSSATAIMATAIADAVKIAIRPATENQAAIAAIVMAVINVIIGNNIIIPSSIMCKKKPLKRGFCFSHTVFMRYYSEIVLSVIISMYLIQC